MFEKYIWRKMLSISLILTLATIGISLNPTAGYIQEIAKFIPYAQPIFRVAIAGVIVSTTGLAKASDSWNDFELNFGRSLYLPALIGVVTVMITYKSKKEVLTSLQFLASLLLFITGFYISWRSGD